MAVEEIKAWTRGQLPLGVTPNESQVHLGEHRKKKKKSLNVAHDLE